MVAGHFARNWAIAESAIDRAAQRRIVSHFPKTPTKSGNVTQRRHLNQAVTRSTGILEPLLEDALHYLTVEVGSDWIRSHSLYQSGLERSFLHEPLVLAGSYRIESTSPNGHEFARAIFSAMDFLANRQNYDFYFGARAVPQIAALGLAIGHLRYQGVDISERVAALKHGEGQSWENAAFELLVASALLRKGFAVKLLSAKGKGAKEKTPDLFAVSPHYPIPIFIECKRKQAVTALERTETQTLRPVFNEIRDAVWARGMSANFSISFTKPIEEIDAGAVIDSCMSILISKRRLKNRRESWGKVCFSDLGSEKAIKSTRLYSPRFLAEAFRWQADMPENDGGIFQVRSPSDFSLSRISGPVSLRWNNLSQKSRNVRARGIASLLGDACAQIPSRSLGVAYLAYEEIRRTKHADRRTAGVKREMKDWMHRADIRLPVLRVNRLYFAPTEDGGPDVIENSIMFLAKGVPKIFDRMFPTLVYTSHP